eukprot:1381417-Rhodomonas_salina.3
MELLNTKNVGIYRIPSLCPSCTEPVDTIFDTPAIAAARYGTLVPCATGLELLRLLRLFVCHTEPYTQAALLRGGWEKRHPVFSRVLASNEYANRTLECMAFTV